MWFSLFKYDEDKEEPKETIISTKDVDSFVE